MNDLSIEQLGIMGEQHACDELQRHGWTIEHRTDVYQKLDVIASKDQIFVGFDVKTRPADKDTWSISRSTHRRLLGLRGIDCWYLFAPDMLAIRVSELNTGALYPGVGPRGTFWLLDDFHAGVPLHEAFK